MRIVIAADIYPPDIGGPATYASSLRAELLQQGHTVDVICYADHGRADDGIVRVSRKKVLPLRYWTYYKKLIALARKADIIYAMGPVNAGLPACAAGWFTSTPYVVKVVGDYAWEQARNLHKSSLSIEAFQYHSVPGKIDVLKKIERFVCRQAQRVIVPSEFLKKIVMRWGAREENIAVIYNAITLPSDELRHRPKDKHTLVTAGRFVPWKGFDTLITLMPRLRSEVDPALKLKIFGSGPMQEELEELIVSEKLQEYVSIQHVSHDKMLDELSTAGAFILNSEYEGLPHVVLEALSVGLPVALSDVGGMSELAFEKFPGCFFAYNNADDIVTALKKVYTTYSTVEYRQSDVGYLDKFSRAMMFDQTMKLLKTVCAS